MLKNKNKIALTIILFSLLSSLVLAYINWSKKPEIVVSEKLSLMRFKTVESLLAEVDLIIEVEVLDNLSTKNSYYKYYDDPTLSTRNFYSLRKVRVLRVLSDTSKVRAREVIKVAEPLAISKNNVVSIMCTYPYESRLMKKDKTILFLQEREDGNYTMMQEGTAQINKKGHYEYGVLLDIILSGDNSQADKELLGKAIPSTYEADGDWPWEVKEVQTEHCSYSLFYRYPVGMGVIFLQINYQPGFYQDDYGYSYFLPE